MKQSPQDIYKSLVGMILPDEILNFFDVVDFREVKTGSTILNGYPEKELHIYLDESDMMHRNEDGYKSNGFTEECIVHDFPIRDRKAILHVRRRRWITPDGHNEVLDYGELLGAKGTKLSREFATFLKSYP